MELYIRFVSYEFVINDMIMIMNYSRLKKALNFVVIKTSQRILQVARNIKAENSTLFLSTFTELFET